MGGTKIADNGLRLGKSTSFFWQILWWHLDMKACRNFLLLILTVQPPKYIVKPPKSRS